MAVSMPTATLSELQMGSGRYLTVPLQQLQQVGVSSLHTNRTVHCCPAVVKQLHTCRRRGYRGERPALRGGRGSTTSRESHLNTGWRKTVLTFFKTLSDSVLRRSPVTSSLSSRSPPEEKSKEAHFRSELSSKQKKQLSAE